MFVCFDFYLMGLSFLQAGEKVPLCLEMGLNALELNWMMNQKHQIGKDLINF
jgi:hypothetical protein